MRRPRRTGAPYKLIMQTNCAALIFIRHRKRPLRERGARSPGVSGRKWARSMSRWFEGWKAHRGRTEADSARLRGNRRNLVEESLLSSAIRLPCKRARCTRRAVCCLVCQRVLLIFVTPDVGCYEFENINLIRDWREASGIVNLLHCWPERMQHRCRNKAKQKFAEYWCSLFSLNIE